MFCGLKNIKGVLREHCSTYIRQTSGAIAIMFAIMIPVLIGMVGMALDFAQAYLVQQRLAQAIDAAALAGAASSADPSEIEQKIQEFFDINYPPDKLGVTFDPEVQVVGNEIIVSGTAYHDTSFLKAIGIDTIDVAADTTVVREVQGLEVVLVLDNTGSMATNNNIEALRTASENFINILFDRAADPDFIRIGMVPYSNAVRVGRYGLGQNPDGSQYADGDVFVTLPPDMQYTTDHTSDDWYGCVVEHNENGYTAAATYVSNSRGQLWRDTDGNPDGHGWDPRVGGNDPYDSDVLDNYEGPWDVYAFGRIIRPGHWSSDECSDFNGYSNSRCSNCTGGGGTCASDYCFCWRSDSSGGTNTGCPYASVMPLSSDRTALLEHVDRMSPHGNTLSNIGMAWGYRLISPEPPFEEAAEWDDFYWRKAIVVMTDGVNTRDATYSAFWSEDHHNLNTGDFNDRFVETCEALKDQNVVIYTVVFESGVDLSSIKEFYQDCATTIDHYFEAPSQEELINVFEQISRELSNLHIKG